MPDIGSGVLVRSAAADAPLRIGRVLKCRLGVPRIVDAEDGPRSGPAVATEIPDLGVVAVDDQRRVGREILHSRAPAFGDELELAVAIELVAKEIAEADHPRTEPPRDLGEGRLVDLEQAQLGV